MNVRALENHCAVRTGLYGPRLQFIKDRGGVLRLDMVNPGLLEPGGGALMRITALPGTIPEHMVNYLRTNGAIDRGYLNIGVLGELFDSRYAFRKREEDFYLRAGEEMTRENMMSAVIGRLVGREALVPKYGELEGSVIDAVHTLFSTVQRADGFWHPSLDAWNEKKAALDDRGVMIDLSGFNLDRLDLAGANLARMELTGASFDLSDVSEADLSFSKLKYASAVSADFAGALLAGTDFSRSYLMRANFQGSVAVHALFSGADLMLANFLRATLIGAQFDGNWHLFEGDLRSNIESGNRFRINNRWGYLTALGSTQEGRARLTELALQEYAGREIGWGRTIDQAERTAESYFRSKTSKEIVEFLMRVYVDRIVEQEMLYSFRGVPLPADT